VEALKAGNYRRAARLAQDHEELAESLGEVDPEVSVMRGVASGIASGRLGEEEGRKILSFLDEFEEWKGEETEPEPAVYEPLPTEQPPEAGGRSGFPVFGTVVLVVVVLAAVALVARRRTGGGSRRR
jgi:hypothetical protein